MWVLLFDNSFSLIPVNKRTRNASNQDPLQREIKREKEGALLCPLSKEPVYNTFGARTDPKTPKPPQYSRPLQSQSHQTKKIKAALLPHELIAGYDTIFFWLKNKLKSTP
jgi:hypothetical protein